MKKITNILSIYNLTIICLLIAIGFKGKDLISDLFFVLLFIPIGLYFSQTLIDEASLLKHKTFNKKYKILKNIFAAYSFVFVNIFLIALLRNVSNIIQAIFIIILLPLEIYFISLIIISWKKFRNRAKVAIVTEKIDTVEVVEEEKVREKERRDFIKLIAGAGAGVLVTSLINPQKAGAAFFGSVPGPGTITIKDTTGAKVDPAIQEPLDGYSIANYSDSGDYPHYYAFLNKAGAWYVLQETGDSNNSFLYAKGSGGIGQGYNWSNRGSLTYATFDATF